VSHTCVFFNNHNEIGFQVFVRYPALSLTGTFVANVNLLKVELVLLSSLREHFGGRREEKNSMLRDVFMMHMVWVIWTKE